MTNKTIVLQPKVKLADPHDCTDEKDVLTVLSAVYETLLVRDGAGFGNGLAESWTVSEDAKVWTFTLRNGVHFHDGTPCAAEAVVTSLKRMARPDKGYTLGAPGVWHQYLGGAEIQAVDARTVRVVLVEPVADLADILVQGYIAAPALCVALDAGEEALPCGTGAFRVASVTESEIVAERGEQRVIWRAEPDAAARLIAVRNGQAQVAMALPVRDLADGLGTTERAYENPVAVIYLLNAAKGPLRDPRLRSALALALDRDALIAEVHGGAARPLHGIMPSVSMGAADTAHLEPDRDRAKALIAEAGYGGGLALALDCPTRLPDEAEALSSALADQLAQVGVALEVTLHADRLAYAHMVRKKQIGDLCVFDSSPISTFRVLYEKIDARNAGSWWQGYHNPAVEDLLDAARRTADVSAREALYARIVGLLQEDPPWLTLFTPLQGIALAGDNRGYTMPATGILDVASLPSF